MKVVICEDEQYWTETLKTSIAKWAAARKVPFHCDSFVLPQELINHLTKNLDTDVLFLDISLGEQVVDGMTLAKHLREMGNTIPIIFVTVDSLRAADGYLVEAMGFLSKPIEEVRLSLFLDRIIKRQKNQRIIKIAAENRLNNVYQKDIVYVEIIDHTVIYHTVKYKLTLRGTLGEVLVLLGDEYFVQIHRSYVIALDKIDNIKTTYPYSVSIHENNGLVDLPVSRKYINNLMEAFSDDVLEKMI
ncbi:LytR/AlgR family response regulator transcription factor [Lacrimispora sp.]|uniref:LytR/AlgR family response regulator transcription factor n=1 Tax=Lacrimispora sp. TaxID=2719234 RepID=UPI00289A0799|nr:LytTR family DNA-binding domain-containing protein [Lacrimispora sp.]